MDQWMMTQHKNIIYGVLTSKKHKSYEKLALHPPLSHVTQICPDQPSTSTCCSRSCLLLRAGRSCKRSDGGFQTVRGRSVRRRRGRTRLHNIRAGLGSPLQRRFSLGWRIRWIQLASGFDSDRVHFLARNWWEESLCLCRNAIGDQVILVWWR